MESWEPLGGREASWSRRKMSLGTFARPGQLLKQLPAASVLTPLYCGPRLLGPILSACQLLSVLHSPALG